MDFESFLSDLCLRSQRIARRFLVAVEKVVEFCMKKVVVYASNYISLGFREET